MGSVTKVHKSAWRKREAKKRYYARHPEKLHLAAKRRGYKQ